MTWSRSSAKGVSGILDPTMVCYALKCCKFINRLNKSYDKALCRRSKRFFMKMRDESDQVKIPSVQKFSSVASEVPVKYNHHFHFIFQRIQFSKVATSSYIISVAFVSSLSFLCSGKLTLWTILIIKATKKHLISRSFFFTHFTSPFM
jgi:hypothetical protein